MATVLITDFMGDDTALEEALFARAGIDVSVAAAAHPEIGRASGRGRG